VFDDISGRAIAGALASATTAVRGCESKFSELCDGFFCADEHIE